MKKWKTPRPFLVERSNAIFYKQHKMVSLLTKQNVENPNSQFSVQTERTRHMMATIVFKDEQPLHTPLEWDNPQKERVLSNPSPCLVPTFIVSFFNSTIDFPC